jgi:hypothetical protein
LFLKMVVGFDQPAESLMETNEAECPLCMGRMEPEDRDGTAWLVCPNGCPTELEAPIRKPVASETETQDPPLRADAAGS